MISHDNAVWTSNAFLSNEPEIAMPGKEHTIVSYLPLSHIAAQALDIFFPLIGSSGIGCGSVAHIQRSLEVFLAATERRWPTGCNCRAGAEKAFYINTYYARPDALRGSLKVTVVGLVT